MLGLALAMLLAPGQVDAASSRLAVIQQAPNFTLTTQAGTPFRLADARGKVVLVSFIFTTCSGSCPATTARMAQVQQQAKTRGLTDHIRFVSITLDPARDTPEALRNYARLYALELDNWSLLTGSRDEVAKVVADWGMWAKPAANGQLDHPSRVFLVDPRGQVREVYNVDLFKIAWVLDDMQLLLQK